MSCKFITYYFHEISEIITGNTPPTAKREFYGGDVPFVSPADLGEKKFILSAKTNLTDLGLKEARTIPKNSILLCCIGATIGKVGIAGRELVTNQQINSIIFDPEKVDYRFGYYFCTTLSNLLRGKSNSTTLPIISKGKLLDFKIPVPPLPIQQKIAAILDAADELRQKDKALIAKYNELAQSLFLDMFAQRTDTKVTLESLALKEKGTFSNGPFGSDLLASELKEEGVPVVYIRDIRNGNFVWKSNVFVTAEKAKSLPSCQIKQGDILITKVGDPPGVAAIYPNSELAIMTQDVIRIRTSENINNNYLKYWLNSNLGENELKGIIVEGTRMRFSLGDFKLLKVPLPLIELQNQFAHRVELIEKQKQLAESGLKKSEELFNSLLNKAFKGELVCEGLVFK